jgi:hypothetical protein
VDVRARLPGGSVNTSSVGTGEVQSGLIGDLGRTDPVDRGVEVAAGPVLDRVDRERSDLDRKRRNLS